MVFKSSWYYFPSGGGDHEIGGEKTKLSARSRPLLASSGRDLGATPSSGIGCFYCLSRPACSKIVMCEGDHDAVKGNPEAGTTKRHTPSNIVDAL